MKNKAKILNDATKFLQKGAYDKAIRELQKLVEDEPKDVRTILKIGDIYAKKGDREDAIKAYRRVAELYSEQGFFLKAVAVYKQILKLEPQHFEVTLKLAELYEQLGLLQEALGQYGLIATLYEQRGDIEEWLTILKRMVELDADNIASRVRLAEAFSREGRTRDAVNEFKVAAQTLKNQGRQADFMKVAERLIYHDAEQHEVAQDLARFYLGQGDARRAVTRLEPAYRGNPHDTTTLGLLGRGFRELGMTERAVFIYHQLSEAEAAVGRREESRAALMTVLELDPNHAGAQRALAAVGSSRPVAPGLVTSPGVGVLPGTGTDPSLSAVSRSAGRPAAGGPLRPGPTRAVGMSGAPTGRPTGAPAEGRTTTEAPRRSRRASSVSGSARSGAPLPRASSTAELTRADKQQVAKLITETDVYVKYGLRERALEHLRKILEIDPDSVEAYRKMRDLYLAARDRARAAESVASLLRIAWRSGEQAQVAALHEELIALAPGHPMAQPGADMSSAPAPSADESGLDSIDIDVSTGDFDDHEAPSTMNPAGAPDRASIPVDFHSFQAPEPDDVGDHDIVSSRESLSTQTAPTPLASAREDDESGFVGLGTDVDGHVARARPLDEPLLSAPPSRASVRRAPLAAPAPQPEPERLPASALQLLEPEPLDTLSPLAEGDAELLSVFEDQDRASAPPAEDLEADLENVEFLESQGLLDEARDAVLEILRREPLHARAVAHLDRLENALGLRTGALERTADEQPSYEPEVLEPRVAHSTFAAMPDPAQVATWQAPEDDALSTFRPSEVPVDDATAAHQLELGHSYRAMGLHGDAATAYEAAARNPSRAAEALECLGQALKAQGDTVGAVTAFYRALELGPAHERVVSLKLEVAIACEASGDGESAVQWYGSALADDPTREDVRVRIMELGGDPSVFAPAAADQVPLPATELGEALLGGYGEPAASGLASGENGFLAASALDAPGGVVPDASGLLPGTDSADPVADAVADDGVPIKRRNKISYV